MVSTATLAHWDKSGASQLQSVRPKDAAALLGIGPATLWRWAHRPDFPKPIKLSPRCTVFAVDQLIAWRDAQRTGAAQ